MPDPKSPSSDRALYELNPTGRFTDRADTYRRHRPSYPAAAIDAMLAGLGAPSSLEAADIGAGTGISSRLLAERGARVHAVEPNQAMREAAGPHPLVRYLPGTAEETGLPDRSVNLVLAAQAFHWFRPEPSLREFHRILKPNGRLAVMWNERDLTDPLTAVYSDLAQGAARRDPVEKWHLRPEELYISRLFTTSWEQTFSNSQELDAEGLIGRALSASYVPTGGPDHEALVKGLRGAFDRYKDASGKVRLVYRTILYLSEPLPG